MTIPVLRPDYSDAAVRRPIVRAITAVAMCADRQRKPLDMVKAAWPDDPQVPRIVKAAFPPLDTSMFPAAQSIVVIPALAPSSASSRLLSAGMTVSLVGIQEVKLPYIGAPGRPRAIFIGEGQPAPVVRMNLSDAVVGPCRKIVLIVALSRELLDASPATAETIISSALATSAEQAIDSLLFSTTAATPDAPAGLLAGLTPIVATACGGMNAIATDLGNLAAAFGAAGLATDDMVIVTTPELATKLKVQLSPKFTNTVLSSGSIAAGTVVGVLPGGLISAYQDGVAFESSIQAAYHEEDTTPQPLMASPARSLYQTDAISIRVRARAAWATMTGAVQYLTGATW
jgi:hypothetical protein